MIAPALVARIIELEQRVENLSTTLLAIQASVDRLSMAQIEKPTTNTIKGILKTFAWLLAGLVAASLIYVLGAK